MSTYKTYVVSAFTAGEFDHSVTRTFLRQAYAGKYFDKLANSGVHDSVELTAFDCDHRQTVLATYKHR